jgi:N-methylhydantoinase A
LQIDVPLRGPRFAGDAAVAALREDFHATHRSIFAIDDPQADVEIIAWHARASCHLRDRPDAVLRASGMQDGVRYREASFPGAGWVRTPVLGFDTLPIGETHTGPALVESSFTTLVLGPGATFARTGGRSVSATPAPRRTPAAVDGLAGTAGL